MRKLSFLAAALCALVTVDLFAVALIDFKMKLPISVNATAAGEKTATDLPVLVRLSESITGFKYSDLAANGSDLAFGVDDETTVKIYPHEIDTWDPTGESLVWVKVPSVAAGTSFNAYYGNNVTVASTATSVWSGYKAVWHMNEASGNAIDATTNHLDAVPSMGSGYSGDPLEDMVGTDGRFGKARINATDAAQKRTFLSVPAYKMTEASKFTISGWFRMTDPKTGYARLFSSKKKYNDAYGFEIECAKGSAENLSLRGASEKPALSVGIPSLVNDWVHLSFVYDSATVYVYANGALAGSGSVAAPNEQYTLSIGSNSDGSEYSLYGKYDEVRLMDGTVSANRAALEYAAMADAGFLAMGSAEMLDVTMPKFSSTAVAANATAGFDVSFVLAEGAGTLKAVLTDVADSQLSFEADFNGGEEISSAGVYSMTVTGMLAGHTYECAIVGESRNGTPVRAVVGSVYNGGIQIKRVNDADEMDMSSGFFKVSLVDGGVTVGSDVTVSYTIGGTAVAGETYEEIEASVVIPAGGSEALIEIKPIYSTSIDEDVDVMLTLNPGPYLIGDAATATVVVKNSSVNPYVRYVAMDGNDANNGYTISTAMATLQAAIDSLDEFSDAHDCTVYVADGTYEQPVNVEKQYCVYITGRISVIGMTRDPKDVVITRNASAYAIFNVENADAKLQYLTISNGKLGTASNDGVHKGGGVYLAKGVVEDCIVTGCNGPAYGQAGVGIYVVAGRVSRCEIRNCTSSNDEANGTGVCLEGGLVEDTLVTGCSCKNGGAIKLSGSATAVNCTVVDNTGTSTAGIRIDSDTAKAVNCAIFGNKVTESMTRGVYTETRGACYVNCAADLEIVGGVNCIRCRPVFKDWANGDYRPVAGSPLLNAGGPRTGATSETDLLGKPRVVGTADIGCYENQADVQELGLFWIADKRTLPTTVSFAADTIGVDSPTYSWTLHNETTGEDKMSEGKSFDLAFDDADAGTYTVSVTAGGLTYVSPDKLQLSPAELYVDAESVAPAFPFGSETPSTTVQAAIDAAVDGATIFIAPGTYPISAQMTVTKALRILGTGAKYTDVVITNTVKSANHRIFVLQHADAFVANLTMAGGYTIGGEGGNLLISGKGGTVSNCWLTAATTDANYQQGSAAAHLAAGLLTHCEISRCNSMPKSGHPQPCTRVLYVGNGRASNCLIHDCDYRIDYVYGTENGTRGGGEMVKVSANGILDNCTIVNVVNADSAAVVYVYAAQGGFSKSSKVVNCAIFGNDQNGQALNPMLGGTAHMTPPTVCFKNCATERPIEIFYAKSTNGLTGLHTADESNITNAMRAACFVDYANGNYRVKEESPMIDVGGTFAEVPQLAQVDLAGKSRIVGAAIDIGCYELQASAAKNGLMIFFR